MPAEEQAEKTRIISAYMGTPGVVVLPDLVLLGNAKDQGFPSPLATELGAFNDKRSEGIHRYLLGQGTYQGIGDAYRNADGLFERIMDVLDLPSFGSA